MVGVGEVEVGMAGGEVIGCECEAEVLVTS